MVPATSGVRAIMRDVKGANPSCSGRCQLPHRVPGQAIYRVRCASARGLARRPGQCVGVQQQKPRLPEFSRPHGSHCSGPAELIFSMQSPRGCSHTFLGGSSNLQSLSFGKLFPKL
jgi:hypothetical protein